MFDEDEKIKRSKRIEKNSKKKRQETRNRNWKKLFQDEERIPERRELWEDLEYLQSVPVFRNTINSIGRRNKRSGLYFHRFTSLHKDEPKRAEDTTVTKLINEGLDEINDR